MVFAGCQATQRTANGDERPPGYFNGSRAEQVRKCHLPAVLLYWVVKSAGEVSTRADILGISWNSVSTANVKILPIYSAVTFPSNADDVYSSR